MRNPGKNIREILKQDIQISDVVETRIQETYKQLGRKKTERGRRARNTAAAIAVVCFVVPGVVYASSRTEFLKAVFGDGARESNDVIHREIDDGKGGKAAVTLPSREYVPVDEEMAEGSIGNYVMDAPVEKKIGSHILTVNSFVYDRNGAVMYFTLERKGGVTAFAGDRETNLTKGAYFTEDADFYFYWETKNGTMGGDNTYVDLKKSTDDKLYCYSYILWDDALKEGDVPQLILETYPCARRELTEKTEVETEKLNLTDKGQIPTRTVDLGEKGYVEYSPISLSVDMAKGLGLTKEEAEDPYYMKHLEIVYKDKESYVIRDKEKEVENSSYQLAAGTFYKTLFNRLVDVDEIAEIRVNGVGFPVG